MHGKQFLLDSVYAGINSTHVYGRLDFCDKVPEEDFEIVVNLESWAWADTRARRAIRMEAKASGRVLKEWEAKNADGKLLASSAKPDDSAKLALLRNFEFKLPLVWLLDVPENVAAAPSRDASRPAATTKLRLRFSLWQNRLPVDSLPLEGWIDLHVVSEGELLFGA
jgi:hypothetical protein